MYKNAFIILWVCCWFRVRSSYTNFSVYITMCVYNLIVYMLIYLRANRTTGICIWISEPTHERSDITQNMEVQIDGKHFRFNGTQEPHNPQYNSEVWALNPYTQWKYLYIYALTNNPISREFEIKNWVVARSVGKQSIECFVSLRWIYQYWGFMF